MAIISELPGSPVESQDWAGAFQATARYRVAWATRHAEMQAMLNWPRNQYPGKPGVFAKRASLAPDLGAIAGVVDAEQYAAYEFAIMTVEFQTPTPFVTGAEPVDVNGDGSLLVTESIEPQTEFQLIPSKGLRWVSDNVKVPSEMPLGRLECESVYTLTRYHWQPTDAQFLAIARAKGKTNDQPVSPFTFGPNYVFAAETLLFYDPSYQREWRDSDVVTATGWTATFRYGIKEKDAQGNGGWNQFWRPSKAPGGGYDSLQHEEAGPVTPYPLVDFASIFVI